MGTQIIPADDTGEFTITREMLVEHDATTLEAFEILLSHEAEVRRLELSTSWDPSTGGTIVAWRPVQPNFPKGGNTSD